MRNLERIDIPFGVMLCLYGGIVAKIDYLKACHKYIRPEQFDREISYVAEAVEFYRNHCVLSAKYLQDMLDELVLEIQGRKEPADPDPQPAG